MIIRASQVMPLAEALRLTFTPGNECSLCVFIAENRIDSTPGQPASNEAILAKARKFFTHNPSLQTPAFPLKARPSSARPRPCHRRPPAAPVKEVPVPPPRLTA